MVSWVMGLVRFDLVRFDEDYDFVFAFFFFRTSLELIILDDALFLLTLI